jgi:hypothetical protein
MPPERVPECCRNGWPSRPEYASRGLHRDELALGGGALGPGCGGGGLGVLLQPEDALDRVRVALALLPGGLDALFELPGEKALSEPGRHGLRFLGPGVVAEAEVGEADRLGEHPALPVVLVQEGVEAQALEVVEGDEGEDGVAQLGVFVLVDAPESLGRKGARERFVANVLHRVVAVAEDPGEVVAVEAIEMGDDGIDDASKTEAFARRDGPQAAPRLVSTQLRDLVAKDASERRAASTAKMP